jgi:hypothetical protein
MQNHIKTKLWKTKTGLAEWLKWKSICLASMRPWAQTLILQKKRKDGDILVAACEKSSIIRKEPFLLSSQLGTVAHTCNPSYLVGGDWEVWGSSPAWAKTSWDSISTNKKLAGVAGVAHVPHPGYGGSKTMNVTAQYGPGIKGDPI